MAAPRLIYQRFVSKESTNSARKARGPLALTAQSAPNQPWMLQLSTNLVDWIGLGTNTADSTGQLNFQVPVDPTVPKQFLRLQSP